MKYSFKSFKRNSLSLLIHDANEIPIFIRRQSEKSLGLLRLKLQKLAFCRHAIHLFLTFLSIFILNCFAHVDPKGSKNCEKLMGTPGPEDMAIDRESEILYISSHERREKDKTGIIFTLDLKKDSKTPTKLESNYPNKFAPHGIFFAKISGTKKLYVISHPKLVGGEGHTIEIFKIEKDKMIHEATLKNELLLSPNDLFVTQDGKIYVSNDVPAGGQFGQILHVLFQLNSSPISYYNGKEWSLLSEKTAFGNGIFIKKENGKEYLYRSSHVYESVLKYELNYSNGGDPELKLVKKIELGSGPDNLEEENGNLLVAAHKSNMRFMGHAGDKEKTSPTQIFRIFPDGVIQEIYANDGEEISAASTGITFKNKLFISQVFEPFILACSLDQ
jgi:arylesterase / paraoxonase